MQHRYNVVNVKNSSRIIIFSFSQKYPLLSRSRKLVETNIRYMIFFHSTRVLIRNGSGLYSTFNHTHISSHIRVSKYYSIKNSTNIKVKCAKKKSRVKCREKCTLSRGCDRLYEGENGEWIRTRKKVVPEARQVLEMVFRRVATTSQSKLDLMTWEKHNARTWHNNTSQKMISTIYYQFIRIILLSTLFCFKSASLPFNCIALFLFFLQKNQDNLIFDNILAHFFAILFCITLKILMPLKFKRDNRNKFR